MSTLVYEWRKGNGHRVSASSARDPSRDDEECSKSECHKRRWPHGNDRTVAQDALWTERECCRQLCNAVWPALSGWNRTCAAVPLHCTRSESACLLGSSAFIRIRGNRRGDFSAVGTGSNLHSPTVFCCPLERTRVTKIHIDCQSGKWSRSRKVLL